MDIIYFHLFLKVFGHCVYTVIFYRSITYVSDLLSKELGQLDSADEKLEKMLEGGINTDSSSFNADGMDQMGAATPNSMTADGVQGMGGAGLGTAGEWGGDAFGMQVGVKQVSYYF